MSIESTLSNLFLSLALLLAMSGIGFGIGNRWYWVGVVLLALVSFGFDKLAKAKPLPQPMHLEPPPVQQRPLSNRIKMAQVGESLTVSAALENIDPLRAAHLREQQEARNGK